MKKIIVTAAATSGLLLAGAPAVADDALAPCPAQATVQTVTEGCALPAYPDAAKPAVNYLTSAFYVLNDMLGDALHTISALEQKVADQRATIKHLRAKVARLR